MTAPISALLRRIFRKNMNSKIISAESALIASIVDSIVISKCLGLDAMGSYGLAMPVVFIANALGKLISDGATRQCGLSIGHGDAKDSRRIFSTGVLCSVLLSLALTILFLAVPESLAVLLGADGSAGGYLAGTAAYLRGYAWGIPAYVLLLAMIPFVQLEGKMAIVSAAGYSMAAADIVFDLLNAYVFHGGLWGMAFATSLSEIIGLGVLLIGFLRGSEFRFSFADVRLRMLLPLLRDGSPGFFSQFFTSVRSAAVNNAIVAYLPIEILPLFSGISSLMNVLYPVGKGIGNTAMLLASVFYGEEDSDSLWKVLRLAVRASVIMNLALTVVVELFAPLLLRLFLTVTDAELALAAAGLRVIVLSLIPCSVQTAYRNYVQGIGRIVQTTVIIAVYECVISVFSVSLLAEYFSVGGFWVSFIAKEVLALVFDLVMVLVLNRIGRGAHSLRTAILQIRDNFGIAEEDSLTASLFTEADAAAFADSAEALLCDRADVSCAPRLAGAIRERAVDVFGQEFPAREKPEILIRVYRRGTDWTVRFRDNGIRADGTETDYAADRAFRIRSLRQNVLVLCFSHAGADQASVTE